MLRLCDMLMKAPAAVDRLGNAQLCFRASHTMRVVRSSSYSLLTAADVRRLVMLGVPTAPRWRLPAPRLARLFSSSQPLDPYGVLSVGRSANQAEIKRAYFLLAKRFHPDVNKSPDAARKFREAAEAYEVLGDPARRRAFDSGSGWQGARTQHSAGASGTRQQQQQQQPFDPHVVFRGVWNELGLADIDEYLLRTQREFAHAMAAASSGNLGPARQFASDHRALLLGTIVPVVAVFRFPAANLLAFRAMAAALWLSRIALPLHVQWRLFSRLWVRAVLFLEKAVGSGLPK